MDMERVQNLDQRTDGLLNRLRRLQVQQCTNHIEWQLSAFTTQQPHQQQPHQPQEPLPPQQLQQPQQPSQSLQTQPPHQLIEPDQEKPPEEVRPQQLQPLQQPLSPKQITKPVGSFLSNIKHLEDAWDSDATESSSGGESCGELDQFSHEFIAPRSSHPTNAPHHSINMHDLHKRAIWKWATERCRLASKWTWLQAQVADLEFKIRQHSALHQQIKSCKDPLLSSNPNEDNCSRTIPISANFKRRRLIKSSAILTEAKRKMVKFGFVPCVCSSLPPTVAPCLSCNGRYNYMMPFEHDMPLYERVARLDPCCHPVLSFPDDVTLGHQISYLLKQEPMKNRSGRKKSINESTRTTTRKHDGSNKRTKRDRRASSISESSLCGSPHSESSNHHHNSAKHINRRRRSEQHAYDINNIVIPFSIAATTRVEILEYKEIMTPSWRVWENGNHSAGSAEEEEIEDLTDEAYAARHIKCEFEEKKRFSLKPTPETIKMDGKSK